MAHDLQDLQLWALMPAGGPKSLGVLGTQPVMQMPADDDLSGHKKSRRSTAFFMDAVRA